MGLTTGGPVPKFRPRKPVPPRRYLRVKMTFTLVPWRQSSREGSGGPVGERRGDDSEGAGSVGHPDEHVFRVAAASAPSGNPTAITAAAIKTAIASERPETRKSSPKVASAGGPRRAAKEIGNDLAGADLVELGVEFGGLRIRVGPRIVVHLNQGLYARGRLIPDSAGVFGSRHRTGTNDEPAGTCPAGSSCVLAQPAPYSFSGKLFSE